MTHVVFLEDRLQVLWARQRLPVDSTLRLIAVTAEALEALDECRLPHEAISVYADARQLADVEEQFNLDSYSLAQEIESFVAERYAPARFEGPGFLSGQGYHTQYSISAILTRAFLMRETIRACSPSAVTVFDGDVDPWLAPDGYARNPWLEAAGQLAGEYRYRLEIIPRSALKAAMLAGFVARAQNSFSRLQILGGRIESYVRRKASEALRPPLPVTASLADLAGLRLLLAGSRGYDWAPVLAALRSAPGVKCFAIEGARVDVREWTYYYASSARQLGSGARRELGCGAPRLHETEKRMLAELFDDWLRLRPIPPQLNILGIDLFPLLVPHLKAAACIGPALARHADLVAEKALEITRPHAVCFTAMPWLAAKRLAFRCQQLEIPVVCYQHGGTYGTHVSPKNEQIEAAHADFFLAYGDGIRPREMPAFPSRAKHVPIGSARLESLRVKYSRVQPRTVGAVRVLWIGEISSRNTLGGTFHVEDTQRFLLDKQCLELLDRAGRLRVVYRPYPHQVAWDGTARWLKRARLRFVRMDLSMPLAELIHRSDVVITTTTSGTVWNEVLALNKPLILYCDPAQTSLMPGFATDVNQATHWCKSKDALVAAVRRLAAEPGQFLQGISAVDPRPFLEKYVLHQGKCVPRVLSFLDEVCRGKRTVEEWQAAPAANILIALVEGGAAHG